MVGFGLDLRFGLVIPLLLLLSYCSTRYVGLDGMLLVGFWVRSSSVDSSLHLVLVPRSVVGSASSLVLGSGFAF